MAGVYLIYRRRPRQLAGAVQATDSATPAEVLRRWCIHQGLTENARRGFEIDYAPVLPWADLKAITEPD